MTAYSDIINKTASDAISGEGFDARQFAPTVYRKISKEDRKRTSYATIAKDLRRAAATIEKQAMRAHVAAQLGFAFLDLPGAVAVDEDGHKTKSTMSLRQAEFTKARKLREDTKSSMDASIMAMVAAEQIAAPHWKEHPDWTLGQCLEQAAADGVTGAAA